MNHTLTCLLALLLALPAALHAAEPRPDQSSAPAPERTADPRPNLVFVFSDQQSSDMLGCYGNKQVISPNLDRLAAQGVRFNHCISSAPICTPYRGMLLSGQHPLRNGAFENDVRMLPGDGKYFGEVLRDNGYRLGYYGKWHLYGGDRDRPVPPGPYRYGFDHEFVINNCTLDYDKERAYLLGRQRQETTLRRLGALRPDPAGHAVHRPARGEALRLVPLLASAAQLGRRT